MIDITNIECSEEFSIALIALEEGKGVRRKSWPVDMVLRELEGRVVIFQAERQQPADWNAPSIDDAKATDWIVI